MYAGINTSTSSYAGEETLFTIADETPLAENEVYEENLEVAQNNSDAEQQDAVLCLLFKNGKIAAAIYKIYEKMLYILNEMVDLQPEYAATRTLIRETNPLHIVTLGNLCDMHVKRLIDMLTNRDHDTTFESDQLRAVPNVLSVLSYKDYRSNYHTVITDLDLHRFPKFVPKKATIARNYNFIDYNHCELRVKAIRLTSEPENMTEEGHELYLHSLINFQSKLTVHALGTLLKFTEKSWAYLNGANNDQLNFHHISPISLLDHVYIDKNTFNALQIFQRKKHDASFKHGGMSSCREGVSLYKLFSQHCTSKVGYMQLRNLMLKPIKNIEQLTKRLDFIHFVQQPRYHGFIEMLQDNIRHISDINLILSKVQHARASGREWETIYKTIYHILLINELCAPYLEQSELFDELSTAVTVNLYGLERCIDNAFDFKTNSKSNRPVIKSGLDAELDKSKMIRDGINKQVTAAATIVVDQLPAYLDECTVFYIPDMGHVVSVKKWPNYNLHELEEHGFQFMFELQDNLHYKNALCQELDKHLGDVQTRIVDHENRIIERVAGFVLRYNHYIREPTLVIGTIDCLISMAKVATEKDYVRPTFNTDNIHEIVDGRHPLLELTNSCYVSNNFTSGTPYSHIKIITGPNASGKSVYLKQTALLIYLAHIGSYIPAKSANIAMVHSIHSRIQCTESAVLRMSAFMIDITQMSQALYNAQSSSLVLMDEFGKGTTGREGLALITSALRKFLSQERCPHVLVSTHLELDPELLDSPLVLYQKMDHTRDEQTDEIVFLYKIIDGTSTSYAAEIAASVDLDETIVKRARQILESPGGVVPMMDAYPEGYDFTDARLSARFFKRLNIPELTEN